MPTWVGNDAADRAATEASARPTSQDEDTTADVARGMAGAAVTLRLRAAVLLLWPKQDRSARIARSEKPAHQRNVVSNHTW